MRYRWLIAAALIGFASPRTAAEPAEHDARVDRAIARGLESLRQQQDPEEGCWLRPATQRGDPALTSLAVMAFLSAGRVPGEGRDGEAIEKGIRWVLAHQKDNGLFGTDSDEEMYQHGIATLMLAETAGMTDRALGQQIRASVARAVAVILQAQRKRGLEHGGWRYRVANVDSDLSVTGWQIMALRAAKNLGCDVPVGAIERAIGYVQRSQDSWTGGFRYRVLGGTPTVGCTGTGVLALELCGKKQHRSPEVLRAGAYLIRKENLPSWDRGFFFYDVYYGSQATFQLGGNYWSAYRPRLHEALLDNQSDSGFWEGRTRDAQFGGRPYCTAMAILALTVEYRLLPIYQRDEDAGGK